VSIGPKIKELRGDQSQEDLAHDAGISVSTLSRIERGLHKPELTTLRRLAAALAVPLIELVEAAEADSKPRRPYGNKRR
jgi:transcriptional regulator with XRE-family HTH domain